MIDAELVARLNAVPLPAGLLARLRSIPLADDADLDAALAEVILPADLIRRLSSVPQSRLRPSHRASLTRWPALASQAAAAVVLCALSLGYALSVMAFVAWRFEQRAVADDALRSTAFDRTMLAGRGPSYPNEPFVVAALETLEAQLVALESQTTATVATSSLADGDRTDVIAQIDGPPALAAWSDVSADPSPAFAFSVDDLSRCCVERASVRLKCDADFDRFWRQTGLLPWLGADRQPAIEVPLATDDASFRVARRELGEGRLPAVIRVEEFLAAVDFGLDGESERPTVVAVAPSPFGRPLTDDTVRDDARRWLVMIAAPPTGGAPYSRSLVIRFFPERVKAFRLLGYAPAAVDAVPDREIQREDLSGNADASPNRPAVVLLEIEANDGLGRPPHGATIVGEVSCRGPESPQIAVPIDEASFSDDFDSAPVAWRQAALVALAAETLAGLHGTAWEGHPPAPLTEPRSLAEIAALARQIEPVVSDRAGWCEFIEMLARAQRVRAQSFRSSLLHAF